MSRAYLVALGGFLSALAAFITQYGSHGFAINDLVAFLSSTGLTSALVALRNAYGKKL